MKASKTSAIKRYEKSTFEQSIKQAREEVATWPEWKRKHISIGFSEYQRKQEEKREKQEEQHKK